MSRIPFYDTRLTRRLILALAVLAIAPAAFFFARPGEAAAANIWCAGDPAIIVNGVPVDVTVHLPANRLADVDYVDVIFHVPSNATVAAVVNDSLLFRAKVTVVKDGAARSGLLSGTAIGVDIIVHYRGPAFPIAATTIAAVKGTSVWTAGTSDKPLHVTTYSRLNLGFR